MTSSSRPIVSLWSNHDTSFCVASDEGEILVHTELERHSRIKEDQGDACKLLLEQCPDVKPGHIVLVPTMSKVTSSPLWNDLLSRSPDVKISSSGHHEAHAAHAYYSSPFDEAIVITLDGGGIELDGTETAVTISYANGPRITRVSAPPLNAPAMNPGGVWTRVTRYVFGLESGWPYGHQAGTVMSMAAFGDPDRFFNDFDEIIRTRSLEACLTPTGHVKGMSAKDPAVPLHPFLSKWKLMIKSEQDAFDMAAAFQAATNGYVIDIVKSAAHIIDVQLSSELRKIAPKKNIKNLCFAGGVALNSVAMGKLVELGYNVYVPPVPYDGGLTIGAVQKYIHGELCDGGLQAPRGKHWIGPYCGRMYTRTDVENAARSLGVTLEVFDDNRLVEQLAAGDVVSVFNERAESGRRALGNRSILADPRQASAKDRVNERVKHRQSHRPFAPSIMRERVKDWFEHDIDSPFMSHVLKFKQDKRHEVPAVVHVDGSARLQTVTKEQNPWYHSLLQRWERKTGVPILLNTSLNDREPVCETPEDAIKCFLKTDIDLIYFPEHRLCARKR